MSLQTMRMAAVIFATLAAPASKSDEAQFDTALVIAIDVSQSVDDSRYKLQMGGIASALEDPGVISAITSGINGKILVSLIAWSDSAETMLPWQRIESASDAFEVAKTIRSLPVRRGEFTCMARMLETLPIGILNDLPSKALRIVIDVSGDGIDNCAERKRSDQARDSLIASGMTLNGLPIIVAGENEVVGSGAYRAPSYGLGNLGPDTDTTTVDAWYSEHVIGGPGAFLMKADGYEDFGRAFRQKFVTEISALRD